MFKNPIYSLYDIQQIMLTPARLMAEAAQVAFQSPYNPLSFTGMGRSIAAGAEVFERITRRFGKPQFGLSQTVIAGQQVQVTEEIVAMKPFCHLMHFKRHTDALHPKLLIVAPMSGHHATLLRGTVAALLPEHDVYITDWVDAKHVPMREGTFDLEDYIAYVIDFIKLLGGNIHLLAVCQPAVPVLCAVSLMAESDDADQPRSVTLMGGPIDIAAANTAVTDLAAQRPLEWFKQTVISSVPAWYPGAFREVYPGFIQLSGFMSMNLDRHVGEHLRLFQHLVRGDGESADTHRKFYDEYLSVMDITAEFYLQTVERVFQKRSLATGTFTWRGHRVKPEAITKTALFTIEGELDDISAPGQTKAAHTLCSNLPADMKKHVLHPQVGHYGIFNGRKWREQIMPQLRDFIRQHDQPQSKSGGIRLVSSK
ncbi:MAG: polyhydroxyalkanoate depolymerase [Bdellovibrionales bacterium]